MKNNNLKKVKDSILVQNNANTIFKRLATLEKDGEIHKTRWFWELLQNAKDAVNADETVDVKLVLKGNVLSFSHTGNPFAEEDVVHLIFHGSSKAEDDEKTGRFGTGFMTTHLLSRKINIKGKLISKEKGVSYFDFLLDRTSTTPIEQKQNLDISYHNLEASITENNFFEDKYQTVFTYKIDDLATMQESIADLRLILPAVLSFNKKIKTIEIEEGETTYVLKKVDSEWSDSENYIKHTISIKKDDILSNEYVITYPVDNSEVAILVEKVEDKFYIKELANESPRLFYHFPLFGTHDIGFPVIINSKEFEPYDERDGVYLGKEENIKDKQAVLKNKSIIATVIGSIPEIINELATENYQGLENLFRFNIPQTAKIDKEWLLDLFYDIIKELLDLSFITVESEHENDFKCLNDLCFPFPLTEAYYEVSKSFYNHILSYEEVEKWEVIIEVLEKIVEKVKKTNDDDYDEFEVNLFLSHESFCENISNLENIIKIRERIGEKVEVFQWFNEVYEVLNDKLEDFSRYNKIIPNQKGNLKNHHFQLFKDNNIDENLKSIAENLGVCPKHKLIHQSINIHKMNFINDFDNQSLLSEIDTIARDKDEEDIDEKFEFGLASLLKWRLDNNVDLNKIKKTQIITSGKEDDKQRTLFQEASSRILASYDFWKDDFSIYKDLVKPKYILNDIYSKVLEQSDIDYLAEEGLIYAKPLIKKKCSDKKDIIKFTSNNDLELLEDKKVRSILAKEITYSYIPYLTANDDGILSKTKGSEKSSRNLLNFITLQVLERDNSIDEVTTIDEIDYPNCLWVQKLKNTSWVRFKSEEDNAITGTVPSTASISPLLNKNDELIDYINKEENINRIVDFFNKLEISISDVLRNRISDENEKKQWDLTFTQLLTNEILRNDPELAQSILQDEGFVKKYQDRKQRQERIDKNRTVGVHFESIFKQIFESVELNKEFKIERKTIGRDFEIHNHTLEENIPEFDSLNKEEKELILHINSNLIELKTTKVDYTQMSSIQGMDAVKYKDRFVLAVLPINDNKNHGEKYVKEYVRFIVNIGVLLEGAYEVHERYNSAKEAVKETNGNIRLNLDGGNVRYQINKEFWESDEAKNFDEFIDWLKNKETKYKDE